MQTTVRNRLNDAMGLQSAMLETRVMMAQPAAWQRSTLNPRTNHPHIANYYVPEMDGANRVFTTVNQDVKTINEANFNTWAVKRMRAVKGPLVRVVMDSSSQAKNKGFPPAQFARLMAKAAATAGKTLILGDWSAGGPSADLASAARRWTTADMKAALAANTNAHLNFNEWGPADPNGWAAGNKNMIGIIRGAGITNPILVDAGEYGQKPESIINKGKEVADSDSLKKTNFAVHAYSYWYDNAWKNYAATDPATKQRFRDKYNIADTFAKMRAAVGSSKVWLTEYGKVKINATPFYTESSAAAEAGSPAISWFQEA